MPPCESKQLNTGPIFKHVTQHAYTYQPELLTVDVFILSAIFLATIVVFFNLKAALHLVAHRSIV